jgi:hypothetical protein
LPSGDGVRFAHGAILDPYYKQAVQWLNEIHEQAIRKRIAEQPHAGMTYAVQFDDERLKLLLRPLSGPRYAKANLATPGAGKIVAQLIELEKSFDWLPYYKLHDKLFKEQMALDAEWNSLSFELHRQIPLVQTEWGMQKDPKKEQEVTDLLARKQLKNGIGLFQKYQQAWMQYFNRFADGAIKLQQIKKSAYFDNGDKQLTSFFAEVQARALEAIERMIWLEYGIVERGELLSFDERLIPHISSLQHQ